MNEKMHIFHIAAADPFVKVEQAANELTGKVQAVALFVFIAACVVTGVIYGLGSQDIKKLMKRYWWGIVVGIVMVTGAAAGLSWLWDFASVG